MREEVQALQGGEEEVVPTFVVAVEVLAQKGGEERESIGCGGEGIQRLSHAPPVETQRETTQSTGNGRGQRQLKGKGLRGGRGRRSG